MKPRIPPCLDPFTLDDPNPLPTAYERRRNRRRSQIMQGAVIAAGLAVIAVRIAWMHQW